MIEYLATCKRIGDVPVGATLVSVNGKQVVAICEGCGGPIYESTQYTAWADGPYTHKRCPKRVKP